MKRFLFIVLLVLFSCSDPEVETLRLSHLWEFKNVKDSVWRSAEVPGTLHTDLMKHKLIKDPFVGMNEKEVQWIEEEDWEYRTKFQLNEAQLQSKHIDLHFEGLDTYTSIYINGKHVSDTNNMFRSWRVSAEKYLHDKINTLRIIFHSPMKMARNDAQKLGYTLPAGNDQSEEKLSVFTRKAPYHYGWDWGPRLVTSGIWKRVSVKFWNDARIKNVQIIQKNHSDTSVTIIAKYEIISDVKKEFVIDAQLSSKKSYTKQVMLNKGLNTDSIQFQIRNPEYWWTNGLGNPALYRLYTRLKNVDGKRESYSFDRFGVRTLELIQEPDSIGKSFYFKLNGKKLYAKGANVIPMDSFIPRTSRSKLRRLFQTVKESNMNMLRVWGGGVYGSNEFYRMADQNGILIWQDFIFANSMYNMSEDFEQNITEEIRENITRIRNHPSLALWCGNNEIDVAWHNWGWQSSFSEKQKTKIWNDYKKLFHKLIPNQINQLDKKTPYVSTSPLSNWGTPKNFNYSSMHYWGVWHGEDKFEKFEDNVPRFMSEYGFQSYPNYQTVRTFADSLDINLYSDVMKWHQKSYKGNRLLETHMNQYYKKPKDFKSFLYVNELVQAKGLEMAIDAHRRNKGHNMGTLYWQLNDCWPGASWSSMDYNLNWKAAQYQVKKSYRNTLIIMKHTKSTIEVYMVTDESHDVSGTLKVKCIDFSGTVLNTYQKDTHFKDSASQLVYTLNKSDVLKKTDRNTSFLEVEFTTNRGQSISRLFYFNDEKYLKLMKPTIKKILTKISNGYELKLRSNKHVKNVMLSLNRVNVHFSNNYFDMIADREYTVQFKTDLKLNESDIQTFSLLDSYE